MPLAFCAAAFGTVATVDWGAVGNGAVGNGAVDVVGAIVVGVAVAVVVVVAVVAGAAVGVTVVVTPIVVEATSTAAGAVVVALVGLVVVVRDTTSNVVSQVSRKSMVVNDGSGSDETYATTNFVRCCPGIAGTSKDPWIVSTPAIAARGIANAPSGVE